MLAQTPPMGWNSWNTFGWQINEELIKGTADIWSDLGLLEAGYNYLVIDDCWSEKERDENGLLVPDKYKFPNGIKEVSDYVHSKGLKFGMYSCCGSMTCGGHPSSFEHEFSDAKQFADWGVDYLKYDYCYKPYGIPGHLLYKRMSLALRNTGRDILFSACSWGSDETDKWARESGTHMYRSTGDIQDNWESVKNLFLSQEHKASLQGPGCYNDIDMLVVGMHGKGNVALGGCNDEEYRSHFSMWAIFGSPLMIGCDIRNMDAVTKEILTNKEVIAVNQDIEGRGAFSMNQWNNPDVKMYARMMHDGSVAIGMFNFGETKGEASIEFWDLGIPSASGFGLKLRDLWAHEDIGVFKEHYRCQLEPHCCKMLRGYLVKD